MNQDKALEILKSGRNVFLTGAAGAGKTWLLRQFIRHLRGNDIRTAITASTGIAATHLHGQTIHSWSGMGVRDSIDSTTLKKIYKYRHLRKNIDKTKVLIVDEISMLHQNQFVMLDQILRFFKGIEAPFGGIQVVLCGDFFQLPPISKEHETGNQKFAFMSNSWVQLKPAICYLTEQYRQKDDRLSVLLNSIRNRQLVRQTFDQLTQATAKGRDEEVVQLHTHNVNVDKVNNERLARLDGPEQLYKAQVDGRESAAESLRRNVMAPQELKLKKHAQVLFVKNNPDAGYMNGTLGQVTGFTSHDHLPVVLTKDQKKITVEQESWKYEDEEGKAIASYTQIPLRLAWAITVHKSQGMSLDAAHINLNQAFEPGQGYVALSRLRSFDGLSLDGYNDTALEVDPLAYKADLRFRQLSEEAQNLDNLEEDTRNFIARASTRRSSANNRQGHDSYT